MKKFTKYIIILVMFSCDRPEKITRTYILENGTDHSIKIDFFLSSRYEYTNTIDGKGILSTAKKSEFEDRLEDISAQSAFLADSVIVTYNNRKRTIYTRIYRENYQNVAPNTRNILNDSSYFVISNVLYQFTFTEEDYENAEDLQ